MQTRTIQVAAVPVRLCPSPVHLAFASLIAAAIYAISQRAHLHESWMEDVPVYARAMSDWLSGHSPYNGNQAPLFFLYPPAFLFLAGFLAHLVPAAWGTAVYVSASAVALVALPLVLARYLFRQPWLSPWFALLLFFAWPRFTGIGALRTMNIASLLYCLAFTASIFGLRRNRWGWFYLAVFLAAAIKITFLALLLLPLLAGARQWTRSILCGAAVIAANLAERFFWPDLYHGYEWSLGQGIVGHQAFGYGVFGVLANYHFRQRGVGIAAYLVSGALALLLTGLMFYLRRQLLRTGRTLTDLAQHGIWLAMIVVTIVLVNPREMQYDMDIALFAAYVLLVYALHAERWLLALAFLTFLPSLAVPHVVSNPRLYGIYETITVLAAFAFGYWRLFQSARAELEGAAPHSPLPAGFTRAIGDVAGA